MKYLPGMPIFFLLPFSVPPNRGMEDVHNIELVEKPQPNAKSSYHQGP